MIDLQGLVFTYDPTRELLFAGLLSAVGLTRPLIDWYRSVADSDEVKAARRVLIGRGLLLLLLLPPVVWAMSEGRLGATIRQRRERLVGESAFHRYLRGVDLEAASLTLHEEERYGRRIITIEGSKRGERLRIDGFRAPNGISLRNALLSGDLVPHRNEPGHP